MADRNSSPGTPFADSFFSAKPHKPPTSLSHGALFNKASVSSLAQFLLICSVFNGFNLRRLPTHSLCLILTLKWKPSVCMAKLCAYGLTLALRKHNDGFIWALKVV
jgi:hypothetical protein